MPSNKTTVIFIICFGIVVSVYLLARNSKSIPLLSTNNTTVSANPYINVNRNTNSDWQNILTAVEPGLSTTTALKSGDPNAFDETTLTAQLSRDMFSRYLLIANKAGGVTSDDATQIANDVLSNPEYTTTQRNSYSEINLHITQKSDKETFRKYSQILNQNLNARIRQIQTKDDPLTIFSTALNTESQIKLNELNQYIASNKGIISDLLAMEVPKEISVLHLNLLNAFGNSLSDLESMGQALSDPSRGLLAVNQYAQDWEDFQVALGNLNNYYKNKFGANF